MANIQISRRSFVAVVSAVSILPTFCLAEKLNIVDGKLSVEDAHEFALDGSITLIDIRRPDEWVATGIGEGAQPLDMRRKDFVAELDKLVLGDRARPIALICARGVRSKWMSQQLAKAGFTQIIDVPEGMLGSRAGPGWVRIGLPVEK